MRVLLVLVLLALSGCLGASGDPIQASPEITPEAEHATESDESANPESYDQGELVKWTTTCDVDDSPLGGGIVGVEGVNYGNCHFVDVEAPSFEFRAVLLELAWSADYSTGEARFGVNHESCSAMGGPCYIVADNSTERVLRGVYTSDLLDKYPFTESYLVTGSPDHQVNVVRDLYITYFEGDVVPEEFTAVPG